MICILIFLFNYLNITKNDDFRTDSDLATPHFLYIATCNEKFYSRRLYNNVFYLIQYPTA